MKAVINGKIIVPDGNGHFVEKKDHMLIFDTHIREIVPQSETGEDMDVIDAGGAYISPGFINVHIHGCAGFDTMDATAEALSEIAVFQASSGVTSFCPTTMTEPFDRINKVLAVVRELRKKGFNGAEILGVHMEGPFVSHECAGAQDESYILTPDFSKIEEYSDVIKIITVAPEVFQNEDDFIDNCQRAGIIVSFGHSAADYDIAAKMIKKHGITHITHLCNGMKTLHHRSPALIGAALDGEADCELIADNFHVHPVMQRLIYRMKQGKHIMLITDSLRPCGLGDGPSEFGGRHIEVKGLQVLLDDGTIAGSVLTMDRAVANFAENTGISIVEAVQFATEIPARNLHILEEKGTIETGKRADLVIFDDKLKVHRTIVGGRTEYILKGGI